MPGASYPAHEAAAGLAKRGLFRKACAHQFKPLLHAFRQELAIRTRMTFGQPAVEIAGQRCLQGAMRHVQTTQLLTRQNPRRALFVPKYPADFIVGGQRRRSSSELDNRVETIELFQRRGVKRTIGQLAADGVFDDDCPVPLSRLNEASRGFPVVCHTRWNAIRPRQHAELHARRLEDMFELPGVDAELGMRIDLDRLNLAMAQALEDRIERRALDENRTIVRGKAVEAKIEGFHRGPRDDDLIA